MLNKSGATQWTIGRLMMIVLLVVVLALVMYGVSVNGLNPLIEKMEGMFNSTLIMFNLLEDKGVRGDCVSFPDDIDGVGSGTITLCKESCAIELEEGLDVGKIFNWTQGSLFVKKGSQWERIFDVIDNLPLAVKEREVNKILKENYESYVGLSEDSFFMGSREIFINILVERGGGRKYFRWDGKNWFEENDNKEENKIRGGEIDGLRKIYLSSKGFFGGDVSYRIGISDELIEFRSAAVAEGAVSFYKPFDIFRGDSGKIKDDSDFKLFQDWFFLEAGKVIENQKVLNDELKRKGELLPSESVGDFEGEPYYLFLVRYSDGEGVFYLKTSQEIYGLKGEELRLVKDNGDGELKYAESFKTLVLTEEEFEESVKIHKVRKILEAKIR